MAKLTERGVASAKPKDKVYRLSDGAGLLLEVRPAGGRAWLFRFMLQGRRRDMGLGAYPAVGLADARRRARAAAAVVEAGQDPIVARVEAQSQAARQQAAAQETEARTFRAVAEKLIAAQAPGWTSGKTMASWRLTLDKHAYPVLAEKPVDSIDRDDVLAALLPVWSKQPATGRKLQRRIAAILDYAKGLTWRSTDNPATGRILRLTKALPKTSPEKKQPSLPWQRVPAFLAALQPMEGTAAQALRFGILSAVRSAEVRHAVWPEIDLEHLIWTIPAARMKGGKAKDVPPHRVPITSAMIEVLCRVAVSGDGKPVTAADLPKLLPGQGRGVIFPTPKGGALSDAALGACIRRMNEAAKEAGMRPWDDVDGRQAVPHGFRRSFRSWVDDTRPAEGEAAERALAHEDNNSVRAAYRGSDMLEQRRPLMGAWGKFCAGRG